MRGLIWYIYTYCGINAADATLMMMMDGDAAFVKSIIAEACGLVSVTKPWDIHRLSTMYTENFFSKSY